jgi:hypothetical protein
MSAAATAAGYLYASGRLRGREKREDAPGDKAHAHAEEQPRARTERPRIEKPVRVAAIPAAEDTREPSAPRRTPTIQYRTRRWKPEQHGE